jgi:NADP-dependent 3-hydroxy acid dehydrogenase YdfG
MVVAHYPSPNFKTLFPSHQYPVISHLDVTAYGGFLVAQAAAKRMLHQGSGAIFFTGASASVKGFPLAAPFAMGKFALRGLAQSIARELAPNPHFSRMRKRQIELSHERSNK